MRREEWNRRYLERDPHSSAEPHVHLAEAASGLEPGRALDLACGSGRNAVWLAQQGWGVTGVDYSDAAIEQAAMLAERSGVAVTWVIADLLEYEPAEQASDLVLLFFLQLPAHERDTVIRKAARAVAPDGTFLLAAHDRRNLAEGHHGPRDPDVLYSTEDVLPQLDGLEVMRSELVHRTIEADDGPGVMVDALVQARRTQAANSES